MKLLFQLPLVVHQDFGDREASVRSGFIPLEISKAVYWFLGGLSLVSFNKNQFFLTVMTYDTSSISKKHLSHFLVYANQLIVQDVGCRF